MPTLNLGRVRFNHRGAYNPASSYLKHDTVTDDGQTYAATQDVTPTDPGPNDVGGAAFWAGMLLRGADYNAARDQALQAADDAQESATLAGTRANEAQDAAAESAASMEMAERWANEDEDVEVSLGEFSAYHWYKKAEALGSPNEFDLTADQTSDTRKAREWMAQVLANQQQGNDNAQSLAQHFLSDDPHSQYEKKVSLKAAAYREVAGMEAAPLMAQGFAGVGGTGVTVTDWNDTPNHNCFLTGSSNSLNKPPGGSVNGYQLSTLSGAYKKQFGSGINGPATYSRVCDNGTWLPWRMEYNQANVVGTVSRAGGNPTGAIIERDSNSFGEWTKYADGTMEQLTKTSSIGNIDIPIGAVFETQLLTLTLPQSYIDVDFTTTAEPRTSTSGRWGSARATTVSSIQTRLFSAVSVGGENFVKVKTWGRWY